MSHAYPSTEVGTSTAEFAEDDLERGRAAASRMQSCYTCCSSPDVDMDIELNENFCDATAAMMLTFLNCHSLSPADLWQAAPPLIHVFLSEVMVVPSERFADTADTLRAKWKGLSCNLQRHCRHSTISDLDRFLISITLVRAAASPHCSFFDTAAMSVIPHYFNCCLNFSFLSVRSTVSAPRFQLAPLTQTVRSGALSRYLLL